MKLVTSSNQSHHLIPNHASATGVPPAESGSWMLLLGQTIHFGPILTNEKTSHTPGTSGNAVCSSIPVWHQSSGAEYQLSSYASLVCSRLPQSSPLPITLHPAQFIHLLDSFTSTWAPVGI